MRILQGLFLLIAAFGFGCGGIAVPANSVPPPSVSPTPTPAIPVSATSVPMTATPKDGKYNAKGKITKINAQLGSIELDHEEIPGLMPRMIMEFFVKDKALLNGLTVGDSVDFVIEYKHPTETITSIKKIN